MEKNLVLIRGVQGSGKTTLAQLFRKAGYEHYEADMFYTDIATGKYNWDPVNIGSAHRWCQKMADSAMGDGVNVVISNTFVKKEEMKVYLEMAQQYGYVVQIIICQGRFHNIHGVPEDKVEQKRRQFEY